MAAVQQHPPAHEPAYESEYEQYPEQGQDHDGGLTSKINGMTLDERLSRELETNKGHIDHDGGVGAGAGTAGIGSAPDYEESAYSKTHDTGSVRRPGPGSVRPTSVRAPSTKAGSVRPQSRLEQREEHYDEPSRSYAKPMPIVTTYDEDQSQGNHGHPVASRRTSKAGSIKRPASRAASVRGSQVNGPAGNAGIGAVGTNVGDIIPHERQQELQGAPPPQQQQQQQQQRGVQLSDHGAQSQQHEDQRMSMSPRPRSAFGYRPEPNLQSVAEDGREGYGANGSGRDSRAGQLGRNGTVISRSATLGRNGTLSRATNGGTVGSRRGAFGRGAGTTIGTQPEEVLGRDDIHTRAELSERILDEATLRRLSTMEKKDAKRLSKVIKSEGKAEAKAVAGSIKELERLVKLQKEAAAAERKSQMRLTKWTSKEHKARLRFLKEKERYERVEGELRNAENDYEERRDHAGGLTAQVAEKTQELDDLRGQKAADDREREVKLLALRNPAHS